MLILLLAVTIYGPDWTDYPCSATDLQFANLGTCYNLSWTYCSIDSCTNPQLLSSSVTATTLSTVSISNTPASSQTALQTTHTVKPTQHLSTASIAGVAIGSVAGAIVLLIAGCYTCVERRRGRIESEPQPASPEEDLSPKVSEVDSSATISEKDSSPTVSEKESISRAIELFSVPEIHSETYHEMPAPHGTMEMGFGRDLWDGQKSALELKPAHDFQNLPAYR